MIEILRLNHRIQRDKRISTHVALTSRAFHASKLYYTGQKDSEIEDSVNKVTNRFGGEFKMEHIVNPFNLINQKKKQNYLIVHLTMYGLDFEKELAKLKNKNLLIIIGGEKVEIEFYKLADFNLSVTSQPHSEVSALGVFLYNLVGINDDFKNAKVKVIPSEKAKLLKQL